MGYLLVFLGGGLGAAARHGVNRAAMHMWGPAFPWGTMMVNVVGSLAMGLLVAILAAQPGGASSNLRLFVATGVLGGFTTFSAFSLDALTLWDRGQPILALTYIMGSVVIALIGIAAGFALGRAL